MEKYLALMLSYYNILMLKLNPERTQLMFVNKPKPQPLTKYTTFEADSYAIKPQIFLKILGSYITFDLSNDREWSNPIPLLNKRINQFEKLKSYTDFHTGLLFSNSYIIGCLKYMMPGQILN